MLVPIASSCHWACQPAGILKKYLFIPGIYDSVELILCDEPHISNVQCVPDVDGQRVRLLVELQRSETSTPSDPWRVEVEIVEV